MKSAGTSIVAILALAILASACVQSTGSQSNGDPADATHFYTAWAKCVRQQGGNEPDPTFDGRGQPVWQVPINTIPDSIWTACHPLFDQAQAAAPARPVDPATLRARVEYAQCMRQHSIDFPDPDSKGGFDKAYVVAHNDTKSPRWATAAQACQPIAQ